MGNTKSWSTWIEAWISPTDSGFIYTTLMCATSTSSHYICQYMRNMQRQTWKTIIGASDKVLNGIIDLIAPNKVCIFKLLQKKVQLHFFTHLKFAQTVYLSGVLTTYNSVLIRRPCDKLLLNLDLCPVGVYLSFWPLTCKASFPLLLSQLVRSEGGTRWAYFA